MVMSRASLLVALLLLAGSTGSVAGRILHTHEYNVGHNDETAFPADTESRQLGGRSDFSAPVRVVLDFDEWEKEEPKKPSMEIDGKELESRSFFVLNNGKMRELEEMDESEEKSAMEDLVEEKPEKLTTINKKPQKPSGIKLSQQDREWLDQRKSILQQIERTLGGTQSDESMDFDDVSDDSVDSDSEESNESSNILEEWVQRETERLDALTARRYGQLPIDAEAEERWIERELKAASEAEALAEDSADLDTSEDSDSILDDDEDEDSTAEDSADSTAEDSSEERPQPRIRQRLYSPGEIILSLPDSFMNPYRKMRLTEYLGMTREERDAAHRFGSWNPAAAESLDLAVDTEPRRHAKRDLRPVDVHSLAEPKSHKMAALRKRLEDSDEWDSAESAVRIQKFKFQPIGDVPHFGRVPRPIDRVPRSRIIPTDSVSEEIDDDFPKPPKFQPNAQKTKRASESGKDAAASYERKVTQLTSEEKRLIVERYHESNKRPKGDWFRFGDEPLMPLMRKRHVAAEPKRVDWIGDENPSPDRETFSVESGVPSKAEPALPEHKHHKHHHHPKRIDKRQSGGLSSPYQITAQYGAMAGSNPKATTRCFVCDGLCDCLAPREEICPSNSRCYTVKSSSDGKILKKGCSRSCGDVNSFGAMCSMCPGTSCNREDGLTHVDTATECERERQRPPPPPPVVQPKPVVVAEPQTIEKLPNDDGGFGGGIEKEDDGGFGGGIHKKEPEEPNFALTANSAMWILAVAAALQFLGF